MPQPEVEDLLSAEDPLEAFAAAHRHHRLLALPTSGTSGAPRTILRTTDSWVTSFPHVCELLELDSSSRVWVPGPRTATMNLFAVIHTSWANATRVLQPSTATHAHLTPWALRRELSVRPHDLAGVHLVIAGDRLDQATFQAATAAGARISHYYGAAELSFVAWGDHADALRPFPGVEVVSRSGELWVRSPYVSQGYLEPGRALRRDPEGWTTVGDRGEVDAGFVRVRGREGGITTGGATVVIADIEHELGPDATGELAVLGLPHADLGEVVVAVVTHPGDVVPLRDLARRRLAPAQQPRRWLHLDRLPITDTGKIDRVALAAQAAAAVRRGGDQ